MADIEIHEPEVAELEPEALEAEVLPEEGEAVAPATEDEFSIEIEGEEAAEETALVKDLRSQLREAQGQAAQYRKASAPKIELGEKPTLESSEYDEERFEAALTEWHERKRQIETQKADTVRAAEVQQQAVQKKFVDYRAAAARLPVKDFEEAEKTVISILPDTVDKPFQQVLLNYTKDPAKLVYALGKYPAKLAATSAETDPIRVAIALTELERNLKVTTRTKPPAPEADTIIRGSAPLSSQASNVKGERLLADAEKTGDPSKYLAYKKAQRQAA